jgi:hypothetical protein
MAFDPPPASGAGLDVEIEEPFDHVFDVGVVQVCDRGFAVRTTTSGGEQMRPCREELVHRRGDLRFDGIHVR